MIFGSGLFSAFLLEALAQLTGTDPELLGEKISEKVNEHMAEISSDEITNTLKKYLIKHSEALEEYHKKFLVRMQLDNNN